MQIAGIVLCLSWNFIAVVVCWIKEGGVFFGSLVMLVFSLYRPCTEQLVFLVLADSKLFFLATIYALLGIPLSYLIWYRPLYRAMRYARTILTTPYYGWIFQRHLTCIYFCFSTFHLHFSKQLLCMYTLFRPAQHSHCFHFVYLYP